MFEETDRGHGGLRQVEKLGRRPLLKAAPAMAAFKPARTVSRPRGQPRSTTGRHRAGPGRTNGSVRGAAASDRPRHGIAGSTGPESPIHDYLSAFRINTGTFRPPESNDFSQYRWFLALPQTTLWAMIDDISS